MIFKEGDIIRITGWGESCLPPSFVNDLAIIIDYNSRQKRYTIRTTHTLTLEHDWWTIVECDMEKL